MRRLTFSGHYSYDNTLVLKAPNAADATEERRESLVAAAGEFRAWPS